MTAFIRVVAFVAAGIAWSSAVLAMGGELGSLASEPNNPELAQAERAIADKRWGEAADLLQRAAEREPDNADIYNYLGYVERHRGDLEAAFEHYGKALALDPEHRGAHEYIGEAYLLAGDLAKAEEHLAALDDLCWLPCKEYRELKQEIARYKAQRAGGGS